MSQVPPFKRGVQIVDPKWSEIPLYNSSKPFLFPENLGKIQFLLFLKISNTYFPPWIFISLSLSVALLQFMHAVVQCVSKKASEQKARHIVVVGGSNRPNAVSSLRRIICNFLLETSAMFRNNSYERKLIPFLRKWFTSFRPVFHSTALPIETSMKNIP